MSKIEKNIPIPAGTNGTNPIAEDLRELSKADIGDSIFFPVPEGTTAAKFSGRMTSYISKVGTGWATQRRETKHAGEEAAVEGIRVWKKAELVLGGDIPTPSQ